MLRAGLAFLACCALATSLHAQAPKSIDPGMSQAQVVERLGDPTLSRTSGDFTYLFYKNNCVKSCGMDDVVILRKDSVVDAMFRAPERAYSGKSSSPKAIPPEVAAHTRPGARDVPVAAAVQAGEPMTVAKKDSAVTKSDSARYSAKVKPAPAPVPVKKSPRHKSKPVESPTRPDSVTRDSIMKGSLRIKVMPKNFTPPKADSTRKDTVAQRPPHED